MNGFMNTIINVFQGIMLLLLYLTSIVRFIMIYFKERINPFVLGKGKKGINAVLEYIFFFGLLCWSYELITFIFGFNFHIIPISIINNIIIDNIIMKFIGVAIILLGYIILVLSLIAFGSSWRVGIDKNDAGELITKGIFLVTRNPIFVFIDLYFIGTALINTNIFFCISTLLVILGLHYQILQEEKYLQTKYGNEYIEYKKKVRRYI